MAKRGRPTKSIVERAALLLSDPERRSQIIAAIDRLAQQAGRQEGGACRGCCALSQVDAVGNCLFCGWEEGQPCAQTTRRKYLIALACCAVWGIWGIPILRQLRFGGGLSLHALVHLTRHPKQAEVIVDALGSFLCGLSALPRCKVWPRATAGTHSMFQLYPPHVFAGAFRALEVEAWSAFRRARWQDRAQCPKCQKLPILHDYRYAVINGKRERLFRRWRCLTKKERELYNARRRESRPRRTKVRRNIPSNCEGCGFRFDDLTNLAIAHRQIAMADYTMIYIGHVHAVLMFQAIGAPAKSTVEAICGLCKMAEKEPGILQRWFVETAGLLMAVEQAGEAARRQLGR